MATRLSTSTTRTFEAKRFDRGGEWCVVSSNAIGHQYPPAEALDD